MKYIFTLLAVALTAFAQATIITVSTNPAVPAQYTDLQLAHNAASTGDTLQLAGSTNQYYNPQFSKPLTVVGPGWNGPGLTAILSYPSVNSGSQGSTFQGLSFTNNVDVYVANVVFKECWIYYLGIHTGANNLLVRNCAGFNQINGLGNALNNVFTNNCFTGPSTYSSGLYAFITFIARRTLGISLNAGRFIYIAN